MAEGQRFELWVPCGTAVFKTAAINHSAIPPDVWYEEYREVCFFVKIFLTFYIHPISEAKKSVFFLDRFPIDIHDLLFSHESAYKY